MPSNYHPCDHDCANCTHRDCICNDGPTLWESRVITGALGGWEHEITDRYISLLDAKGYDDKDIQGILDLTPLEIARAHSRIYGAKKRAARVCKHKAAQRKLHTEIING